MILTTMNTWFTLEQKRLRASQMTVPSTEVFGEPSGELLVLSWGGTYGAVRTAVEHKQAESKSVSHVHLRYLNPLPKELGAIMKNFKRCSFLN